MRKAGRPLRRWHAKLQKFCHREFPQHTILLETGQSPEWPGALFCFAIPRSAVELLTFFFCSHLFAARVHGPPNSLWLADCFYTGQSPDVLSPPKGEIQSPEKAKPVWSPARESAWGGSAGGCLGEQVPEGWERPIPIIAVGVPGVEEGSREGMHAGMCE